MKVIRLVKVQFDNLENHNPIRESTVGIFIEGDGITAYGKVAKWLETQKPEKLYIGYDWKFYPKYRIENEDII